MGMIKALKELQIAFGVAADNKQPATLFAVSLQQNNLFDSQTARAIIDTFQQLGLPVPQRDNEFMHGSEGRIIFLNDYGLVIRIEENNSRINDSPWVLQPIASIKAGAATIEICPGVHFEPDEKDKDALSKLALQDGLKFWDAGAKNMGRLPVKTPHFPEGVPVVIDRPSVFRLPEGGQEITEAAPEDKAKYNEAVLAQKRYEPLQNLFKKCWPDTQKMKKFWQECESFQQQGKLVAGWNESADSKINEGKTYDAAAVAHHYADRLKAERQRLSSNAPAVRRWLRRLI